MLGVALRIRPGVDGARGNERAGDFAMALMTYCIDCQDGMHDRHQEVIQPAPEGGVGGVVCKCKGECSDRPMSEGGLCIGHLPGRKRPVMWMEGSVLRPLAYFCGEEEFEEFKRLLGGRGLVQATEDGWVCVGCGSKTDRYDMGEACEECVLRSFAENG